MSEGEEIRSACARKAQIRATVLSARDSLGADDRRRHSRTIIARIVDLDAFQRAAVVMGYCSFGSELDTETFLEAALAQGKKLALPRIDRVRGCLVTYLVHDPAAQLMEGVWGIQEPNPDRCAPIEPSMLDFVLTPGVAFDGRGGRIGYGKGYYDRLLYACSLRGQLPAIVAGAFDVQIVDSVPMEKHDIQIDAVVTEARSMSSPGHSI